ncbi:hypothetical protein [Aurantimonas endophytica]|uniref:Outer membrane biosynthesis protein TonB n=1 Tax=Aurantimonas endophytica TaxID=1522175 RepID=A0A7W6HFB9_9HYPH|nr:hypothetical protein [Aurantimonas endophytica]MBB4004021.1 outer membrane biosynthesis protein TonB [Aurantimonas endophytica]MCO6404870.1 hypothetical protein [Aurantimonas endophytica]
MKSGLVLSTVLHTAVLTWGLWSLSAPEPLEVASVESMPVDLVSIEEFSESVAGARDAPVAETPAPTPTETPETLPMPAESVGENEVDLATPPTPVQRPRPVEQAAAAQPAPAPPEPTPEPEPAPEPEVVETPPPVETPPAEVPAEAPPPEPVEADPVEQAIAEADAPPEVPPAPQNVPVPAAKPTPPRPAVAETREPERPQPAETTERAEIETPEESDFDADQIAALLNREQAAGGGARRSEEQAALGTQRTTGATLSQSELDALRGQIQRCWSPPAGVSEAGSLRISIQLRLDPSGALETVPQIVGGGGSSMVERIAGEAALRAVRRCAPYNLPAEKYETWADVIVNFDPSQMF